MAQEPTDDDGRLHGEPYDVIAIHDSDGFDADGYEDMGLSARLLHADQNTDPDQPNRHAIILGNGVVVVEIHPEKADR